MLNLEFLHNVTVQRSASKVKFPDTEDLQGAAVALMRLQDVYTLDTGAMARGEIQGVKRAKELSGVCLKQLKFYVQINSFTSANICFDLKSAYLRIGYIMP